MLIPILVFFACFGAGIMASARWLPDLGPGPIAGLAFFVVCGLLAAAFSVAGLHIYSTIRGIHTSDLPGIDGAEILASGMRNVLWDSGTLIGLAGIIYLMAPQRTGTSADRTGPAVKTTSGD